MSFVCISVSDLFSIYISQPFVTLWILSSLSLFIRPLEISGVMPSRLQVRTKPQPSHTLLLFIYSFFLFKV